MLKKQNQSGFGILEGLVIAVVAILLLGAAFLIFHKKPDTQTASDTSSSQKTSNSETETHTAQEAVSVVQKVYDDYLAAVNKANSDPENTQPVAQAGLSAVKDSLSTELYSKAAAVTQATPFSCTSQYVADKYTASLASSDKTNATISLSISNGGGLRTDGMTATIDLTTLKIVSVGCPS